MVRETTTEEVFGSGAIVLIFGMIAFIGLLIVMILYTVFVIGPEVREELEQYKLSLKDMDCTELKRMLYEKDIPRKGGYTYETEHEYKWRCHIP